MQKNFLIKDEEVVHDARYKLALLESYWCENNKINS